MPNKHYKGYHSTAETQGDNNASGRDLEQETETAGFRYS